MLFAPRSMLYIVHDKLLNSCVNLHQLLTNEEMIHLIIFFSWMWDPLCLNCMDVSLQSQLAAVWFLHK